MKISKIITDKYKLRIPPTVYYELLADVLEVEEPTDKNDCETCINNKGVLECDMYGCKYEPTTKNDLGVDCISRQAVLDLINADWKYENLEIEINNLPSVTPQEPTTKNNLAVEHHKQNIQTYAHDFGVSEEQAETELRVTKKRQKVRDK